MEESTRVDLQQLKARLAKLGVHIEEPEQDEPSWEALVESNVERHNKTLAQLLGRCTRVQHAIEKAEVDNSDSDQAGRKGSQQKAAAAAVKSSRQQGASRPMLPESSSTDAAAGQLRHSGCRHKYASSSPVSGGKSSSAAKGSAATAQVDSKMLVRAAQQLLEDAEEDAQQVSRTLKAAAVTVPAKRAVERAAGAPAGSNGAVRRSTSAVRRSTSATVAAAASVDDLRSSPLGTVLAQYKEAQAVWAQEKAKLRREAVSARKEASAVRLELAKATRSSEHRAQEASCLKAALKGRDVLLEEMQGRVKQLEDELARCQEVAAERLVSVSRERDDLQALLLATLERLEGVEAVVAAADATSAAMEEKVRVLEAERLAALQTAATARQEVSQLQEARRRLEWQSQLLEKMSKVQLQHNKRKSEALRELLASTNAVAEECDSQPTGPTSSSRARESCSKATAALQDLLDELLNSNNSNAEEQ